jgi:hypothetical protein
MFIETWTSKSSAPLLRSAWDVRLLLKLGIQFAQLRTGKWISRLSVLSNLFYPGEPVRQFLLITSISFILPLNVSSKAYPVSFHQQTLNRHTLAADPCLLVRSKRDQESIFAGDETFPSLPAGAEKRKVTTQSIEQL